MCSSLFLLLGLVDTGHVVGITDATQRCAAYHEVHETAGETATTNAVEGNVFLYKDRDWHVSGGLKLGIEQHYRSVQFDRVYAVTAPKLSVGTNRPDINFAAGIELGKAFWSLTKDRIGTDVKGYSETTNALFSISISVDKFLNSRRKDSK